jgi:integrase
MFIFSCFTGLSYSDIQNLSCGHLRTEDDGSRWIVINRQKTGSESFIRLLDIPVQIIEKYLPARKGEQLFNIPSTAAISNNLRKIEKLCGIVHLHFHMARHTFATEVCLSNGVPMESISKMMGHQSIQTTQVYAEITNQKVATDMKKLTKRTKRRIKMEKC